MADLKVTADAAKARKLVEQIADRLPVEMARRMVLVAEYITGVIRKYVPRGRTGGLMRSYRATAIVGKGLSVLAGSMSNLVCARVRDEGTGYLPGGAIRPVMARMLSIPISPEAKRVGNRPGTFGERLQLIVRKRGAPLLVEHLTKRTIIHWVLKASVKQKGTNYLKASLPEAQRIAKEELGEAVGVAISSGGK